MAAEKTKDMTTGKPLPLLFQFFIPLLLGNLFQQFYSMVDSIIVGKFVGVNALAGVGATGSFNFLILGFAMGICGGFGVMFGQKFGAKDYKSLRNYIANAMYLMLAVSVVLTPITMFLCGDILRWMNTPKEIFSDAYSYIIVILAGIIVTMLYNTASSILRAIGDSKTPLYALIGSSIVNIVLDLVFILVFDLQTFGAGLATVIAQGISGIVCIVYMFRRYEILKFEPGEMKADGTYMIHLLGLGIPMALQFSITAIGSVVIQTAINGLGSVAVAAITAGSKVSMLFSGVFEMIGMSIATFSSQNIGAHKYHRLKEGLIAAFQLAGIACALVICLVFTLGSTVSLLFLDASETEIIDKAVLFLRVNAIFFPALALLLVLRNSLQGMGYSAIAMLAGVFEMIGRSVVAFGFVGAFGYSAVCASNPSAWILASVVLIISYFYAVRKNKEKEEAYLKWQESLKKEDEELLDAVNL